ncbi:MAG: MotA/TolQ/ExbB proton channel family protein [Deltaproteobacteria bacterium]|nr:MotA/TolQ/ExbB proton channel family protein [Deltaproteobacteria bacterium]
MFDNLGFITLLQKGGIAVIVLACFSILSIGVMMERLWAFFKFRKGLKIFFPQIQKALKNGGMEAALAICDIDKPAARIFKAGLLKYREGKTAIGEAMELTAKQEMLYLERYLGVLGTIGSTAPFIGLFGTVLGIIRAFHDLAVAEGAGPSIVADGIAEALVATAAGLFVAVPAVIAYNYFTRKINGVAVELEGKAAEFLDMLFEEHK